MCFLINYMHAQSLQEFTVRHIESPKKRVKFRNYYSDFLYRVSRMNTKKRTKRLARLRQEALRIAEFKNKELYKKLVSDLKQQKRATRLLLTRYRVLEDFNEYNDAKHMYAWYKAKSVCNRAFHSVSRGIQSLKQVFIVKA